MIHHAPSITIVGIVVCYLIFAYQVWHQAPRRAWKSQGGRAIFALIAVFVLCALAGYATSPLPSEWQAVRDALHWGLLAAAIWLVASNQAGAVARMIARDD